ncbi:MAG: hypothetical protein CMN72_12040 [Sphingomonas sp.]|nr:hypothetical protein [Sphingomonas sp.]
MHLEIAVDRAGAGAVGVEAIEVEKALVRTVVTIDEGNAVQIGANRAQLRVRKNERAAIPFGLDPSDDRIDRVAKRIQVAVACLPVGTVVPPRQRSAGHEAHLLVVPVGAGIQQFGKGLELSHDVTSSGGNRSGCARRRRALVPRGMTGSFRGMSTGAVQSLMPKHKQQ